jgi:hypothetical protein
VNALKVRVQGEGGKLYEEILSSLCTGIKAPYVSSIYFKYQFTGYMRPFDISMAAFNTFLLPSSRIIYGHNYVGLEE